nr:MAG TPA: hypothetical protein [Caudoviricetes sp.]
MPNSSRISSRAFLPFWRGTDRPATGCFHSSFAEAASQSSRTICCQSSGTSPNDEANSPANSPKDLAQRSTATRSRGACSMLRQSLLEIDNLPPLSLHRLLDRSPRST